MKIAITIVAVIIGLYLLMWLDSTKTYPIEYGISFNQNHAISLGLDWRETYTAMLQELGPKYVRIAAMWSEVQPVKGEFSTRGGPASGWDFADVDWMMDQALENNAMVVLVVGQKAPRWPECHVPEWLDNYNNIDAAKHLDIYIKEVVERYKGHEALELWQVENEPFIKFRFGDCGRYREDLVENEISLVRELDSDHKILITDSGELSFWFKAIKAGDYFGTTLYRVVRSSSGRIWTYDWLPPAYYRWKAQILGKDLDTFFVAELQAEPWFTDAGAENTPVTEQEKTMNPERLQNHLNYTSKIGVPRAYLWGVEWWYYMKEVKNDSRYWEIIKENLIFEN
jgi:hypothetical protein